MGAGLWEQVDGYCERVDFTFWAEPANALTNLAFLLVAWVMWRRSHGPGAPLARALSAVMAAIGLASGLFHTLATNWAGAADSLSILVFILLYIYATNRGIWEQRPWPAFWAMWLFVPFVAVTAPALAMVLPLGSSAAYASVPLLIVIEAALMWRFAPATARGFLLGATILSVSITLRILDEPLCAVIPTGTHFLWHILNAIMLGWMIEVYRRHMLASARAPR